MPWYGAALLLLLAALSAGQGSSAQAQVLADGMGVTVEALKEDVIRRLAECESGGSAHRGALIIATANGGALVGQLQFQTRTVIVYIKEIEGRSIDAREARQIALDTDRAAILAKQIIFERDGTRHWHNCARKLGLYQEVRTIQKLAR
jgi:hypothetical protein